MHAKTTNAQLVTSDPMQAEAACSEEIRAWLTSIDPDFADLFAARMGQEGFKTTKHLRRLTVEKLRRPPFSITTELHIELFVEALEALTVQVALALRFFSHLVVLNS